VLSGPAGVGCGGAQGLPLRLKLIAEHELQSSRAGGEWWWGVVCVCVC
jgi:hypothetical protein